MSKVGIFALNVDDLLVLYFDKTIELHEVCMRKMFDLRIKSGPWYLLRSEVSGSKIL